MVGLRMTLPIGPTPTSADGKDSLLTIRAIKVVCKYGCVVVDITSTNFFYKM